MNARVTVLRTQNPCNKLYRLTPDGLKAEAVRHPARADAWVVAVPDEHSMAALLTWLGEQTDRILVTGVPAVADGDAGCSVADLANATARPGYVIQSKANRKADPLPNGFSRTMEDMRPGLWEMHDFDSPNAELAAMTLAERIEKFEAALPSYAGIARVVVRSNSGRVLRADTGAHAIPGKDQNGHVYYLREIAPDKAPWRRALHRHSLAVMRYGDAFLTDRSVWGGFEREDFCGRPRVPRGFTVAPQHAETRSGPAMSAEAAMRVMESAPDNGLLEIAIGPDAVAFDANGEIATRSNDMEPDWQFAIASTGEVLTLAEMVAQWQTLPKDGSMSGSRGVRCSTPWRESASGAGGVFIVFEDKHRAPNVMVYDVIGVEHYPTELSRESLFPGRYTAGQNRLARAIAEFEEIFPNGI